MTYDEGVHWTCYCAHQPRCCEFGEPACCSGCEDERDYRAGDDEDDCGVVGFADADVVLEDRDVSDDDG